VVSATRTTLPLGKIPLAIHIVERDGISRGRPTLGLDEALAGVPGVYVANRYNFSQDQRISIRGFGSRSAFAVRGIKLLLDGIPQTLPDGQGQLTNVELGEVDRIEVLRGSSSSLFGNASGGVISIWTNPRLPERISEDARVVVGRFDHRPDRTWSKWQSTTTVRLGAGAAQLTMSRFSYEGQRDHSAADLRNLNARVRFPVGSAWSLSALLHVGRDPRADNPGSLTGAELAANPDTAPALNVNRHAGKDVTQVQAGATLRRSLSGDGEVLVTVFGLRRDLQNPITTTYIDLQRADYGVRASVTRPMRIGSLTHRLTAGVDVQHQRDDRLNWNYLNTAGDSARRDTSRALDQLERVTEVGPFVQSVLELSPRATLTAGLRYDWVRFDVHDRLITATNPDDSGDRLMRSLSGALGIALSPSAALTVYASVGSSFETPTTTELANRPDTAGGFNQGLRPQTAWNYEIGTRGRCFDRVTYSLALFQADVRGELIPYEIAAPRFFYRNAGSSRHRGIELGADLTLVPGVSINTTWTYADYRFRRYAYATAGRTFTLDGRELPGVPRHWLHLTLRAHPAIGRGAWAEVQQTYSSSTLVGDTVRASAANARTPDWWATQLRLGWEGEVDGMRVAPFLGVTNVFNHRYVASVVINAARDRYYEPAPGRQVYLGLSLGTGR
jgi:iron complex outermembrane receptor protein